MDGKHDAPDLSTLPKPARADEMLAFLNDSNELLASRASSPPSELFHYTDVQGLKGILSTMEMWATNAVFLNDRTELLHSLLLLRRIIEDEEFSNGEAGEANPDADKVIRTVVENFYRYVQVYLVCFCTDDDLLSQWRGYGLGGGYSIGFETNGMEKLTKGRVELVPVIYNEDLQRQQLCDLTRRWREAFFHVPPESEGPPPWRVGELIFAETFSRIAISFKNPGFKEEDEWRLVYRKSEIFPDDDLNISIDFRTRDGMLLPYAKIGGTLVGDSTERLPIISINVGPARYQTNAGFAIESYLRHLSISPETIAIKNSPTPLRL